MTSRPLTRHRPDRRLTRNGALLAAALLLAVACGGADAPADPDTDANPGTAATEPAELSGVLTIDPGRCDDGDGAVTAGSYFRMVQSGGDVEVGPFVQNGDSPCGDTTYTPLTPGSDGGLQLGGHQPAPDPAFDDDGHALANRVTSPQPWFAVQFAVSTNPVDPQTELEVPAPSIVHDGAGVLGGDLHAFAASWNNQHFNQGSPKPDGSRPGQTRPVTGTYDPDTGAYTLEWASQIVGGPFDGFTGLWHLEGTLDPG